MSYSELEDTTPAELDALLHEYFNEQDWQSLRFGQIAAVIANTHRDSEKHPEPFKAFDFMAQLQKPEVEATAQDEAAIGALVDDFWMVIQSRSRKRQAKKGNG